MKYLAFCHYVSWCQVTDSLSETVEQEEKNFLSTDAVGYHRFIDFDVH